MQLGFDLKQVSGEKESAVWMQNPNKKSIPHLLEPQPQINGVRKKK